MASPVTPPVAPMLARLVRHLPRDGFIYEPKWDGFRALAYRDGAQVDLRSRNQRPLARYFPELVEGLRRLDRDRFVLDGEIVVVAPGGRFDFQALLSRLHPAASRVERLRRETPASFIAFDLLAEGDRDVRARPFEERRERLESLVAPGGPPILLTPSTGDATVAEEWLQRFQGCGIDGVVAKHRSLPYEPGRRAMAKVKTERTVDCVVAGLRTYADLPLVASLLLGLYDGAGRLVHVGVASSFSDERRAELLEELRPLAAALPGHPWERGFGLERSPVGRLAGSAGRWEPNEMERDWFPLRPERVCEVSFDQLDDHRFRFPARFRRWRPDRDPGSCTIDQLDVPPADLTELLPVAS